MKTIWHFYNTEPAKRATVCARQSTSDCDVRWVAIKDADHEATIWLTADELRALRDEINAILPAEAKAATEAA